MFERFHTGDSAQGSGLGLAIARELAAAHAGHASRSRRSRDETEFTLTPAARRSSRPRPSPADGRVAEQPATLETPGGSAADARPGRDRWSIAGCGSDDSSTTTTASDGGNTRTVERTKVQVVEGLGKNGFDPAAIYDRLSDGVVTVISLFGDAKDARMTSKGGGAQPGLGSGFVLDEQGYVATNAHVVTDGTGKDIKPAKEVYVQFADGNEVPAKIVGFDPNADVGAAEDRPQGPRPDAAQARPHLRRPGRRAGGRDRQPVRRGAVALGRRRLGHCTARSRR